MTPPRDHARAEALAAAYSRERDPSMSLLMDALRPTDDDALADVIEMDARLRLERGLSVTIERYLGATPDLASRRIALDAAIEFSIRAAVRAGRSEAQAADDLIKSHPQLTSAVRVSMGLSEGIASTTLLVGMARTRAALPLPCDFGPVLPDGRKRFDVRQRLGSGTQGDVYLAADRVLAEPDKPAWVAIKRLNVKSMVDAERAEFAEEAKKARRIDHANVVRVLDRGEDDRDGEFVIYEYVDGGDLAAACAKRAGPMPPREAAALMASVCAGVQAAHVAGVVHCDLKPSNVLLTREGVPKVADFGVATRLAIRDGDRVRGSGPIGNLAFIAPEQYLGRDGALAIPADVYALGGLLYHLLTARLPNGATPEEVEARHKSEPAPPPPSAKEANASIDGDLDAICSRALARNPRERYQSAEALGADLRAWQERRPIEWTDPGALRRAALLVRRQPLASAIGVLACVLALAGTAATVYTTMAAREKQYQDRIESMRAVDAERQRGYDSVRNGFESFTKVVSARSLGRLSDDWFPPITMLESLMGPVLFEPNAWAKRDVTELWDSRIKSAQDHIAREREAGRGSSLESALWLDALAFWSLRAEKPDDAAAALDAGDAAWGARLSADDPWAVVRSALRTGTNALRAMSDARKAGPAHTPATIARLRETETALRNAITRLEKADRRGTVRSALVVQLSLLYGSDLLNEPDKIKALAEAETRANSAARPAAPAPASSSSAAPSSSTPPNHAP